MFSALNKIVAHMQIISRFYRFLIVCSVLGLHKGFLKFFFGIFVLMDFVAFSKHLVLHYEPGCGFFMFEVLKQVSKFLGLFLLFVFGMKILYSDRFVKGLIRLSKNGLYSKFVLDGEKPEILKEKSNPDSGFPQKSNSNSDDDECEFTEDVSELRELLKIERYKTNVALAELAKEREASSSAAEEAMAMILRLQREKSLIELESNQYKRLAEAKRKHDQEVIRSLRLLVLKHKLGRSSLEDQLSLCRRKLKICSKDECEEDVESS